MQWVQLKRDDDWGSYYFCEKPLNENGMADYARGYKFPKKFETEVQWPDGTVTTEKFSMVGIRHDIPDMGHTNSVYTEIPTMFFLVRGLKTSCSIDQVKVSRDFLSTLKHNGDER